MNELQKLYDVLVREGKYTKSFEEFQNQWNDEQYQSKVYEVVHRDGLYTKDRNSFNQKYVGQPQQQYNKLDFKAVPEQAAPTAERQLMSGLESKIPGFEQNMAQREAKKKAASELESNAQRELSESISKQQALDASLATQQYEQDVKKMPFISDGFLKDVYENIKKEERLPDFVKDQISSLTSEDIGGYKNATGTSFIGVEEAVVPKMNYMFGALGFKFEESGATGDYMMVKAPNGDTMEISLDNFTDEGDSEEVQKLKRFIAEGAAKIPDIGKYAKEYVGSKQKFNTQKDVDNAITLINNTAQSVNNDIQSFLADKKLIEDKANEINLTPEKLRNTPEFKKKVDDLNALYANLNQRQQDIIKKGSELEASQMLMNQAVGKYSSMKSEQGQWAGGIFNKALSGASRFGASAINLMTDVGTSLAPIDFVVDKRNYRVLAVEAARDMGMTTPEGESKEFITGGNKYYDWYNSLNQDQKDAIESKVRDQVAKETKYGKGDEMGALEAARKGLNYFVGNNNTTIEWQDLKSQSTLGGAILGLAESAPAMLGGSGWMGWAQRTAQMYSQVSDHVYEEMEKNPAFDNVSENEKILVTAPIGIVSGVLEAYGFRNVINSKGLVNNLVARGLAKSGTATTAKTFSDFVKNDVENMMARGLLVMTAAGLAEAETGAAQQISEYAIKDIYNTIKKDNLFDTPEFLSAEYFKDVAKSGIQEAIGGFVMGTMPAVSAAYTKRGFESMDNEMFRVFESIAQDGNMQSSYVSSLKSEVATGKKTVAEAKEELNNYREAAGLLRSIPEGLDIEAKKKAMNLVREKQAIEQSIKDKDEALVKKQKDRIAEINVQLNTLSQNAVQEQATSEVPVQSETGVSEEVERGEPTAEPQVTTEEVTQEEVVPESEVTITDRDKKISEFLNSKGKGYNPKEEVILSAKIQAKKELEAEAEWEAKKKKTLFNRNPKATPPTTDEIEERANDITFRIIGDSKAPSNTDEVLYSVHDLLDGFGRKYGNAGYDHGVRDDRSTWRDGKFFYQVKYNSKGQKYISVISPSTDNGGYEGNPRPSVATVMSFTLPDNVSPEKVGEAAIAKAKEIYNQGQTSNTPVTSKMLIDGVLPVVKTEFLNTPAAATTTTEAVTTPVTEEVTETVTEAPVAEVTVEETNAEIDNDKELDRIFNIWNELDKADDGNLKGAAKAKVTKAWNKLTQLSKAKGLQVQDVVSYKRAKAAAPAVEATPVAKPAPVVEAPAVEVTPTEEAPVAEAKPTKKVAPTSKGKSLLTDKVRGQIADIVKEWNKTKKRYLKETGDESNGRIELEVHGFKETEDGLKEDLLDFDSFSGLKSINKDIERIKKRYPNLSRIDFKYPTQDDGGDWNWITIYEVETPAAAEAVVEEAPAPAPAVEVVAPAPVVEAAPAKTAKEIKAEKELDEEMFQAEREIEDAQDKIEQIKEEIEIEKGNTKEGVAEIKEKMAKVRETVTNKETRRNLLEELEAELEAFKEDQANQIEIYKEDIAEQKAELKKAQRRLDKLMAKKEQAAQPEAAPKKPGEMSMDEVEKRFPLAAEFIKTRYNVSKVTAQNSLDLLTRSYNELMRYKVGAEKLLLQIEQIENLVEALDQNVKKISKEEFKKQIAESGDFDKKQLSIFNALIDSLQSDTMPEYIRGEQASVLGDRENFYTNSLNQIVSKEPNAFIHEIGHFAFFKILSKEDRLKYYRYMIDSTYGKGKPSLASRLALSADNIVGSNAEGQVVTASYNVADNFSEYFAEQFRQWYMSERLFPKDIDTIFGKVAQFFNLFIEKLKSGKYVDKNLSEYFNKISVKTQKQQKKNEKIQEALGIEETMMNELQDLEDFFGIDPEISPMSMRYDTPLQKMALMYNMTESGFFPRNVSTSNVNKDFAQFNLEAKQSASGSYYLVNRDTKKMARPLRQPKGPGTIPIQSLRMSVTPISVKNMSMDDVIETARENGFSDDVIKALLMKRGYAAKDIDSALTFNINFASAYTNNNPRTDSPLPRAFRTIDGGVNAGIKLFFDVRNKLIDFAKSDPKKKKTYAEIRAKAIELLEANPIFQGQEDTKQLELIAAFDKTLNITRGKAISAQIADIRKAIKERLEGVKDLKKAQLILRNFIRQSLPAVKVPRVFFNLEGLTSPAEGINYFNGLRKQIYDFARTDASGVVGKKILVKDAEKIKEFSMKLLKSTELYKKQSPAVQADMENALINSQYTKGPSHTLDIYSQREVNKLIDVVSQTDAKNFLAQAEKVFDIITEQRAKIKNGLLKEMMTLVNKKATSKKTSSGKVRSNGLDAQGQAFYKSIKPIIVAAIKNDTEAMIKIADELSDLAAIQDALDKEAAGEDLTTLERDLLDKVYAFDTFGDILNMELEEVQDLLDGLKGVRSASIVRLNEKRADRAAQREAMTQQADEQIKKDFKALYNPDGTLKDKNELDNDRAMIWQSFKELKIWSGLKQWLERYDFFTTKITDFFRKTLAHLGTISNILDKSGTFFTDNIYRLLNRMDEVNKTAYSNEMKHLDDLANSINGVTKGYRQIRRLIESAGVVKMVINGKTTPKNGDQLLRIYALSLNEVQREKLRKMGYTDQKIEEIKKILGPETIEFADKLVDYFSNEYYESVNDVYSFVNDVNLGYVENYFPTQTLSKSKEQKDAFDADLLNGNFNGIFDSESSPALKERTDMSNPIDLAPSFTNVIESHLQTMERYKAYAVGVKRLNDLFKIESVSTLLDQTGLKSTMKTLVNNSINPNAGINETQARFSGIMNKFSGYALAFKLAQIPKQATAIIAAYEDYQFTKKRKIPGLDAVMFAFDVAKALTFARSNFNKFYNISGNFRDRIVKGVEGDVYGLEAGGKVFKPLSQKANALGDVKRFIKSSAASPTMVGDIISVYGYMANYNRDIANGMSPEAALEKFNNYNATLQSRRTADKSALQFSKSGLVRAFSMFGSTGILQMNKVAMSYKNIMRSIGNKQVPSGKDLRALAINLGVANAAFVAASYVFSLMKGDDEDKEMVERKMFEALIGLNLLYQIPLVGTATEEIVNFIKNNANKSETLKDVFGKEFVESIKGEKVMGGDVTNPYSSVFRKIKKYYDDDNTIIENFRPAAELALGMQLDPFIGVYKGATEEFDDEVMYDILGISPSYRPQNASSLEKMNKTELKRYNPEEYERLYGPGSEDYDEEQAKKEEKAAERKARKDAMDDYYNYESGDGVKRGGSRIKSRGSRTSGSRIK
jgi:hypothetical protein